MKHHSDRRANGARIDHGLDVRIIYQNDFQKVATGTVQDINMGGAKIVCSFPFQLRDKVILEIGLSSRLGIIILNAQVVRVEPLFFEYNTKYSLAFRFNKLTPETREKIKNQLMFTHRIISEAIEKAAHGTILP